MNTLLVELKRELRWFAYSGGLIAVFGVVIALVAWGAFSSVSYAATTASDFHATLERLQSNGEDIAALLAAPAGVVTDGAQTVIANPLRHELDQAGLALSQTVGLGAVASTLSLGCLVFLPVVGFVVGIFSATHDVKSGSIVLRWPQTTLLRFVGSKALAMIVVFVVAILAVGGLSYLASLITGYMASNDASDIVPFISPGPTLGQTLVIAAVGVIAMTMCGAIGLLVGTITRNRSLTIAAFCVAYFLVPMLGEYDPRNWIMAAGQHSYYLVGQFQPSVVGSVSVAFAVAAICTVGVLAVAGCLIPLMMRSRTERWA